jgi:hypothetical protein
LSGKLATQNRQLETVKPPPVVRASDRHPIIRLAHIPPPITNHAADKMKNTVALSLFFLRFTSPIIKKITGGANVKAKHKKINVPIPSMAMTDL